MGILWAVVALIALGFIAGIIGWIQNIFKQKRIAAGLETEDDIAPTQPASSGGCCGMHMTCERDSLLAAVSIIAKASRAMKSKELTNRILPKR